MIKKILRLLLVVLLLCGCTYDTNQNTSSESTQNETSIRENGAYTTKDDVVKYLAKYNRLPKNFITKNEARSLGWKGGGLDDYKYGACIGGDRFGNYEKKLPTCVSYHECDLNTMHKKTRGAERLVYSDQIIYYTKDHYQSFEEVKKL
jgi:guanyl-specific ribonuclease Sa